MSNFKTTGTKLHQLLPGQAPLTTAKLKKYFETFPGLSHADRLDHTDGRTDGQVDAGNDNTPPVFKVEG